MQGARAARNYGRQEQFIIPFSVYAVSNCRNRTWPGMARARASLVNYGRKPLGPKRPKRRLGGAPEDCRNRFKTTLLIKAIILARQTSNASNVEWATRGIKN